MRKGYRVYGTFRRTSSVNFWRIEELGIQNHPNLRAGRIRPDRLGTSIRLLEKHEPDEVYNLAAQSFVGVSFDQPTTTAHITGLGALNLLEAIRLVNPKIRFYQASTSEMFGKVQAIPQNEDTPFYPRSPYGVAKLYAHWMTVNYRESLRHLRRSGILFNHESPLRGREFVTRKITDARRARSSSGKLDVAGTGQPGRQARLGIRAGVRRRHVPDAAGDGAGTFVLATGRTETVRDFVGDGIPGGGRRARIERQPESTNSGVDAKTGKTLVRVNPAFYRPAEVELLIGNPAKAKREAGLGADARRWKNCAR